MDYRLSSDDPTRLDVDLLVFPVFQGEAEWSGGLAAVDSALSGLLSQVSAEEKFEGKPDQSFVLHTHKRIAASRVLLLGVGKRADLTPTDLRAIAARAGKAAQGWSLGSVAVSMALPDGVTVATGGRLLVEGLKLGLYRFERYLGKDNAKELTVRQLVAAFDGVTEDGGFEAAAALGDRLAEAITLARDLVNEPPAVMTPERLAAEAQRVADEEGLECRIFDKAGIAELGMEMILAVNKGSDLEPRFIHLTYRPEGDTEGLPVVAFVGKGLTFDAGGYCLKPPGAIDDMKIDMAGGAAVLGAMKAVKAIGPKCIVHGIVPSTENLISGSAYKTGDVLRGRNGKTVEVMNTDAEGRLILADALTYAVDQGAQEIIDLATLTGACVIALGPYIAGLWGNDKALLDRVVSAAGEAGEEVWAMPLSHKLKKMLKSDVADMKNVGERWGGSITAALFLEEFVGDTHWVHVDLAGPSYIEKPVDGHIPKGGSGFGVLTLLQFLSSHYAG